VSGDPDYGAVQVIGSCPTAAQRPVLPRGTGTESAAVTVSPVEVALTGPVMWRDAGRSSRHKVVKVASVVGDGGEVGAPTASQASVSEAWRAW
jgi:hypothetical protein